MQSQNLTIVFLALLMLFAGGCDQHAADKREIIELQRTLEYCNNHSDGARVVQLFTAETFEDYDRLLKLGLDGTPQQVRALSPNAKTEVLRMRARSTRAELSKMTGRQYVEFATSAGWYITPPEDRFEISLTRFRFSGNSATAEAVIDGWKSGARMRYEKQDGVWKIDEPSSLAAWDPLYAEMAADAGMSMDDFIIETLEEELGTSIPESIWQPMRR